MILPQLQSHGKQIIKLNLNFFAKTLDNTYREVQKVVAELVASEFFQQGDIEKAQLKIEPIVSITDLTF